MARPTQEQLEKINRLAHKELTADDVFVFSDLMIDDQVTSYSSRLHPNLLRKFVKDATKGVGLLMSHDSGRLPVGRSFNARMQEEFDPELNDIATSVYGDFYIDLGRNTESNMTTDDIAQGIESGTIFDTSVGFSAEQWECSICGHDIRDYRNCSHFPGRKYAVQRENAEGEFEDVVETCIVVAGRNGKGELVENSLVYAGACGRATIVSNFSHGSVRENDKSSNLHLIDNLKQVPLDATIYQYYSKDGCFMYSNRPEEVLGTEPGTDESGQLSQQGSEEQVELAKFTEVLGQFGIKAETPDELSAKLTELQEAQTELANKTTEVEGLTAELATKTEEVEGLTAKLAISEETISELTAKNEELSQKAEVAETYRQELCNKALETGVRAQGNAFNKTLYSKFLETLSIDEIKEVIEGFNGEVATKFAGTKVTGTQEPLKNRLNAEPTSRADFESEVEFRAYVADKAMEFAKENGVSIKEATKAMYAKYTTDGSAE